MPLTTRTLRVVHTTRYTYDRPVERSAHDLHLRPVDDGDQRVLSHTLTLDPAVPTVELEDAFGNRVTRFEITSPYTALTISAESVVELLDADPFAFAKAKIRPAFPLVWTPWEQAMIAPYVRPVELPEHQLQELFRHAMSFVARNDADLMETLFDINLTLFREYQYAPGSTDLSTTPHDVFVNRRGVCQDFANLFICLARLLGVPARYVCGYIYTGNVGTTRAGSDATHAWVQLYLPNIGWKGFDPTNGVLTSVDHVRVGHGGNTMDVTPTAGTLYTPATETMTVDVTVSEVR
ncbi:transglutaminase family protein [Sorangium sp. So ce1335]|uniref:transglutaminase family protein n=1 Tax=Sorangium sp. So ce1335 TaxID=3133335 RepID=UPI003F5E934A